MAVHEKLPHIQSRDWNFLTEEKNKIICSKFRVQKIRSRQMQSLRNKTNQTIQQLHKQYIKHRTKPLSIQVNQSYLTSDEPSGDVNSIGLGRFDKLMFPTDFCNQWSSEYNTMKKNIKSRLYSKLNSVSDKIEFNLPKIHDASLASSDHNRYLDIMEYMKERDFNCENKELDIIKPSVNGNDNYSSCFRRLISISHVKSTKSQLPPETRIKSKLDLLIQRYGD